MQTSVFQGWSGLKGNMIALIAGAILPLAFSPFHCYPLAVVSLVLLFASWQNGTIKQAAWRGFLFGIGMFGVGVSWVYVAIHDFGQASVFLAGLLTALFVGFLALYLAALAYFLKRITGPILTSFDLILLLPVAWIVFEWFKAWFLTGFPWLEIGISQIDGPLASYTPFIGALGVSWLVALTAGLILTIMQTRRWWLTSLVIAIWVGGSVLQTHTATSPKGEPIKVSLIQGNIPQEIKWNPEQLFKTLALYQARTEQNWDSDLVIWPENAVTVFHHQAKELFLDPLAKLARDNETDILLGLPVMQQDSRHYFNSMMVLGDEEAFYHKRHLVPFGDYVPLAWLRGLIEFFDLPMSSFIAGNDSQALLRAAGHDIGVSICYEDTFSNEVLDTVPEASLLVNATNNAWYGDSFAPHQHLQISRNRALETGRPVLRATTNGISALIDFNGQIIKQSAQFEEVVLTGQVQARQGATAYVSYGRMPILLISLFMLLVWAYYRRTLQPIK
jgi:apolipoprotein N-acyltransferase